MSRVGVCDVGSCRARAGGCQPEQGPRTRRRCGPQGPFPFVSLLLFLRLCKCAALPPQFPLFPPRCAVQHTAPPAGALALRPLVARLGRRRSLSLSLPRSATPPQVEPHASLRLWHTRPRLACSGLVSLVARWRVVRRRLRTARRDWWRARHLPPTLDQTHACCALAWFGGWGFSKEGGGAGAGASDAWEHARHAAWPFSLPSRGPHATLERRRPKLLFNPLSVCLATQLAPS